MNYDLDVRNNCLRVQEQPGSRAVREDFSGEESSTMIWLAGSNWDRYAPVPGDEHPCRELNGLICVSVEAERVQGKMVKVSAKYEGTKTSHGRGGVRLLTSEQSIATHPNYCRRPDSWAKKDEHIFGEGPSPNDFGRVTDENGAFKFFKKIGDAGRPVDGRPETFKGYMAGVQNFIAQGAYQLDFRATSDTNWAANVHKGLGKVYDKVDAKNLTIPDNLGDRNWLLTNCQVDVRHKRFTISLTLLLSGRGGWHEWIYEKAQPATLNLEQVAGL